MLRVICEERRELRCAESFIPHCPLVDLALPVLGNVVLSSKVANKERVSPATTNAQRVVLDDLVPARAW